MLSRPIATFCLGKIAAIVSVLVVVLAVGACSTSDNRPTQPILESATNSNSDNALGQDLPPDHRLPGTGFYPLDIGNRWTYSGSFSVHIEGDFLVSISQFGEQRELIDTEVLFGRTYVVEEQKRWNRVYPIPPPDSTTYWVRYRQDRAGLYEADVPLIQPPNARHRIHAQVSKLELSENVGVLANWHLLEAKVLTARGEVYLPAVQKLKRKLQAVHAALRYAGLGPPKRIGGPPGGALPNELKRLKYPLHPGQEWTIRAEPFLFTSRVEGREILNLPAGRIPGFRIRIHIEVLGPEDEIFIWYGRRGFLGMRYHLESVATDDQGNPIGILISEEHSMLETVALVSLGP